MTRIGTLAFGLLIATQAFAQQSELRMDDPGIVAGNTTRWAKFVIDQRTSPPTLHYMNGHTHPFHEDYVRTLPGYGSVTSDDLERIALRNPTRELLFGAVLFAKPRNPFGGIGIGIGPGIGFGTADAGTADAGTADAGTADTGGLPLPGPGIGIPGPGIGLPHPPGGGGGFTAQAPVDEYGIQLVSTDPLPFDDVVAACALIQGSLRDAQGQPLAARPFYFPTPDQQSVAESQRQAFAQAGFGLGSPDRWLETDPVYAPGWALGRLVSLTRDQVMDAYDRGDLRSTDVLLVDAAPSELPHVAGVITLSPSSDNSHAVILAQTWEIPMFFPVDAAARAEIEALAGRRVLVRTNGSRVRDMQHLPDALVAEIQALRAPRPIDFPAKPQTVDPLWLEVGGLTPADVARVGGKAAGFAVLEAAPEANAPRALALTHTLWDRFMSQPRGSTTLGAAIQAVIARHRARVLPDGSVPPQHLAALRGDLAQVRAWIEDGDLPDADLAALEAKLAVHFAELPRDARLRFRSSSNLEDGAFSGAGLYDSFSGRAREAGEARFRRTHRTLRRVYASFYNDRAVMERLRHGVDEASVFMGVVVHRSFPDDLELANGVITFRGTPEFCQLTVASQPGEASVVRPEDGAVAERMEITHSDFGGSHLDLQRGSSLLPLGATVLRWSGDAQDGGDYADLTTRAAAVAASYQAAHGIGGRVRLDMEYKQIQRGTERALLIKQVRPLPEVPSQSQTPFIVDTADAKTYMVSQGEQSNAWSLHRLKTELQVRLADGGFRADAAPDQVFAAIDAQLSWDGEVHRLQGDPSGWDGYAPVAETQQSTRQLGVTWREAGAQNPRTYRLVIAAPLELLAPRCPVVPLDEATLVLEATYDRPVPIVHWQGDTGTTDVARLGPDPRGNAAPESRTLRYAFPDGSLRTDAQVFYPPPPQGLTAGYTAPLVRWGTTRLSLDVQDLFPGEADPHLRLDVELEGLWARTLRPEHHNFGHQLVYEPGLSPSLAADARERLRKAGVKRLFWTDGGQAPRYEDFAGQVHDWPPTAGQAGGGAPAGAGIIDGLQGQ